MNPIIDKSIIEAMDINPDAIDKALDGLMDAFIWDEAAEGIRFWIDVYHRLLEYRHYNEYHQKSLVLCTVPGCDNPAIDQTGERSVCTDHDPGH